MPDTVDMRKLKARGSGNQAKKDACSRGGLTTAERYGPLFRQQSSRKGGMVTWLKYGPDHMRAIGKKGAAKTNGRKRTS